MRLNEKIPYTDLSSPTDVQCLLKGVIDKTTKALVVDLCTEISGEMPSETCQQFFEAYYVKPNTKGSVAYCEINEPLSTNEADILSFFLSKDANSKPYLFIDHAGRGKSTILKYLTYYLYRKEQLLKDRILPIYISLRSHEMRILEFSKVSALHAFLSRLIKECSFSIAYEYFKSETRALLKWMNEKYPSPLQGHFPEKKRVEIAENPEGYLEEIGRSEPSKMIKFIVAVLSHYSQHRRAVVIFLDDADNFTIDIQRSLLDFAKQKISLGLKVLVALRTSTWQSLESDRRDYDPHKSPKIHWSLDQMKQLLQTRLERAKESVTVQAQAYKSDLTREEAVKAFVDVLSNDQAAEFLIRTSNYNLHSLMRKLAFMPSSWHFDDKYLLREQLLVRAEKSEHGVSLRTAFNLVFGSYRGSFRSSDDVARCGLINCFCTRYDKHELYTFFVRVHFLARLQDCTNEATSLPISQLQHEYREVFGENLSFSRVFCRTLYRLVQAGLIITLSCRRYQNLSEVIEHFRDDSVYISVAGLCYLNWLIYRIDYLYFMKDDIDWPNDFDLSTMAHVTVGARRKMRHRQTLQALKMLMTIELRMLCELREQVSRPGDSTIAQMYVDLFSARSVIKGQGDILFTNKMLNEYPQYWKQSFPNYSQELKKELKGITDLLNDYSNVINAFA